MCTTSFEFARQKNRMQTQPVGPPDPSILDSVIYVVCCCSQAYVHALTSSCRLQFRNNDNKVKGAASTKEAALQTLQVPTTWLGLSLLHVNTEEKKARGWQASVPGMTHKLLFTRIKQPSAA